MAKSLRSKWKRKMRAVKRERYGKKEDERLIKMLTAAGEYPQEEIKKEDGDDGPTSGLTMTLTPSAEPTPSLALNLVPPFPSIKRDRKAVRSESRSRKSRRDDFEEEQEDKMSVDKPEHVFSKRTMRDQFGNYPAWMNKRKMMTQQKKNKRINKRRAISLAGGKRRVK